jgi:hypothetical protein
LKRFGPYEHRLIGTIDIVSIDVDLSDVDYTEAGFSILWRKENHRRPFTRG